jgi:hypothetical protein
LLFFAFPKGHVACLRPDSPAGRRSATAPGL